MASQQQDKVRPLPKFGEWDVNNPASAEGFTILFNKARDEKTMNPGTKAQPPRTTDASSKSNHNSNTTSSCKKKWLCCGYIKIVRAAK